MRQPFEQSLAQAHHTRHACAVQHIHIQGKARLQIGLLEQNTHHLIGIHILAFGHDDNADILGALITNIFQHGQSARLHQFGNFFYQPRLLHLIGDFGHDNLPLPARQAFHLIARPHPQGAATGRVSLAQHIGRLNAQAAGREIRPLHMLHQRVNAGIGLFQQMQCRAQ